MTTLLQPDSVYFYGTCLIDSVYPNAGVSAVELLQRAGIRVIYPQAQTCCGQPAWNSGYRDEAREVARKQIALFPKDIPIVVPSGSCGGMMKHHYPELFKGEPDEAMALQVAGRIYEFTEFLVDVLEIKLAGKGVKTDVAIHTSCSARREMGVADKIEQLVGQLENITVHEQHHKKECCGFGGTFAIKEPEISASMVTDKADAIRETGASVMITQDCGCMMNISGAFEYENQHHALRMPQSKHIAEFLLERSEVLCTKYDINVPETSDTTEDATHG
ncbi:(Fe-S)-binding protein [Leucothrix pacifica]|uniref:Oxidoreductase n=1 Tax=Leucothrix pacifica TaxID=1247513 RepID=A0A317CN29_9GAMM|nr:(Fe-S)-binding protein [Leucothrix pacifica]PWQ98873.1 oxidoreductase [Leucothrix pacifica]